MRQWKSQERLALSIVALICAWSLPQQARERSFIRPMDDYRRTLEALKQYQALAAEDDGAILPETKTPVQPGDHYDGVPRLIRLLSLLGDLPADVDFPDPGLYQGPLITAVQRFQARHGLAPDGRIDKRTLAQLNTPLGFRVHQLELALERWRRRPYDASRPAIVVNVPEFRLRAFSAANHLDLEMKVVVGQAPERKTPLLSSRLETVIFRPYWNVPLSIQCDELVPEILKDPSFLSANHLEMVTRQGSLKLGVVLDDMPAQLCSGRLRLRQTPGPKNVLGLAKFMFPNEYGIYMHATSAPWLFDRARRDLSHGCIRVESAEDLAEWVLHDESDWSRNRIVKAMNGAESIAVNLKRPIQVVTMYTTAVVLENGDVHFFEDIYGEDDALDTEMQASSH